MKDSIIRATIAPVKVGHLTFEGLMSETKDYGLAVPQVAALSLVPPNRSLKQLEALFDIRFQSHGKSTTAHQPYGYGVGLNKAC